MKVLWFTNNLLPEVAWNNKLPVSNNEGWLVGMAQSLTTLNKDIDLKIVCSQNIRNELICGETRNYKYCTYFEKDKNNYDFTLKNRIIPIIEQFSPNIIHIMGTEFPHALSIMEAAEILGMTDRTIVSLQGLVSVCSEHYKLLLKNSNLSRRSLRDFFKNGGVMEECKIYRNRGIYESKALLKCINVIGRTDWDRACITVINPRVSYYFNNEVLRPEFYGPKWDLNCCDRQTIFFSQALNPLKGFDVMLMALNKIKIMFPNVKLRVAGSEVFLKQKNTIRVRRTGYVNYIYNLINELGLEDNVEFLGSLNPAEMRDAFLKANVFVSSSVIENSPNSVGEAMILGVPVICSLVGGVGNMISHGKEGLLFPQNEDYMLAHYVEQIFSDDSLALELSTNGKRRAEITHSREINGGTLLKIYESFYSGIQGD